MIELPKIPKENSFSMIRLFCCLIVIYEHCCGRGGANLFNLDLKGFAVDVFFIISGFWVTRSCLMNDVKKFYIKRFKKIFPLYWTVVILCVLFLSFFSELSCKEYFTNIHTYKYLLFNMVTLNFLCPSLPGVFNQEAVNGSLWTIKIEIGFYIILPLIVLILNRLESKKKKNIFLFIIYFLSVIYIPIMTFICKQKKLPISLINQLPAYLSYFVCGIFFLINFDYILQRISYCFIPAVLFFLLHYVTKTEFLLPIALSFILFFFAFKITFLKVNVDYSYGMYLVHFPILMILKYGGCFSKYPVFSILLVVSMSFLCSFLFEKGEKAITNLKGRKDSIL